MMRPAFVSPVEAPLLFTVIAKGLGALAIFAGVSLWRGTALGFGISRFIQAIQVVRIYSGPLLLIVALGPQILINLFIGAKGIITTSTTFPVPVSQFIEFSAALDLLGGGEWAAVAPTGVGINLFAALALAALLRDGPRINPESEELLPPR
jgi:hypothetical protein